MGAPRQSLSQLSQDSRFHFEILRPLSLSSYDGADVGECLGAARSIVPGDFESFAGSFAQLASSVYQRALSIAKNKFPVSARTAFFSAATYFRSADFFLHGNPADARITTYWANQTAAFDQGLALLSPPGQRFTIKTAEFDIPCIWLTPDPEVKQRPTIIMGNGYDGSQEEMLHVAGLAALERGYNVLTYEGPGQPTVRREQNIGFTADWEKVVTPVLDHVLNKRSNQVNSSAVALYGLSLGGYLAARAAAFEHRFAAIMALDAVWDFGAVIKRGFGPDAWQIYESKNKTRFDAAVQRLLATTKSSDVRWGLQQGMWAFNTTSPFEFLGKVQEFTLEKVAHQIRTPILLGEGEEDDMFRGQAQKLAAAVGDCAHRHMFGTKDFAGAHSGIGSFKLQNQVVFDWFSTLLQDRKTGSCGPNNATFTPSSRPRGVRNKM